MKHPFPFLDTVETYLVEYLIKKAPALPKDVKEALVTILPWFAVAGIVLGLPAIILALGLSALFAPFGLVFSPFLTGNLFISAIAGGINLILYGLALRGLFKRQREGWNYMYYASLIGAAGNIIGFSIPGLLLAIICTYLLFQVREHYGVHGESTHPDAIEGEVKK